MLVKNEKWYFVIFDHEVAIPVNLLRRWLRRKGLRVLSKEERKALRKLYSKKEE